LAIHCPSLNAQEFSSPIQVSNHSLIKELTNSFVVASSAPSCFANRQIHLAHRVAAALGSQITHSSTHHTKFSNVDGFFSIGAIHSLVSIS
jgi:hypothetical protein